MPFVGQKIEKTLCIQQEYKILAEYKMIESEKIEGIYVIPSSSNSLLWYGVIFVRQGYYEGAIFRFTILLPENFPDNKSPPTIIFQTDIFHPFICPSTGALTLANAFSSWKSDEDHIWQILKYIQAIFLDPLECLQHADKINNEDAKNVLLNSRMEYIALVRTCAETSKNRIYDEPPTNDPHYITFETFDTHTHGSILERIKSGKEWPEPSSATAIRDGLSWVKQGEFRPLSLK